MAIKTALFLAKMLFGYTLAIKTAFFLAKMLFGYTLAIITALFLAVCRTRQAELPLRCLAASAFP